MTGREFVEMFRESKKQQQVKRLFYGVILKEGQFGDGIVVVVKGFGLIVRAVYIESDFLCFGGEVCIVCKIYEYSCHSFSFHVLVVCFSLLSVSSVFA